jgi:catalase
MDNEQNIPVSLDANQDIEQPVNTEPTPTAVQDNNGKSINIIDQTPEAEDLINGTPAIDEAQTIEELERIVKTQKNQEEEHMERPEPPFAKREDIEINVDPEHAFNESDEDYFHTTREKLSSLRKERNELIVKMDKKEDELTNVERKNAQYVDRGVFDKVDHETADNLHREIHELRNTIMSKNRTIGTLSGVLRTL